jgi:hypothetical protein
MSNNLVIPFRLSRVVISSTPALIEMSLSQSRKALLLCDGVDICSNAKPDNVEERDPGVLGKELLRESESQRGSNPADLHYGHETSFPGRMDLMDCPCTSDNRHRDQIDRVLDRSDLHDALEVIEIRHTNSTYHQIANYNLQYLGLQTSTASKDLLENADQYVAQRRAHKGSIRSHLRHAGCEIMAILIAVLGNPRCKQLLRSR